MEKHPRLAGIASFLKRYYAEHKRVSANSFIKASENVLTNKEAKDIFEYMTCIDVCLNHSTKRMFVWNCRQDHFNNDAVEEMLSLINLRPKKDERHKKELANPIIEVKKPNLWEVSLDELVAAIERKGWEVTLKHLIR